MLFEIYVIGTPTLTTNTVSEFWPNIKLRLFNIPADRNISSDIFKHKKRLSTILKEVVSYKNIKFNYFIKLVEDSELLIIKKKFL